MKRIFGRVAVTDEIGSELAFHFEMAVRELMLTGMTNEQARAEAAKRFGNVESVTKECERFGNERDRHANRAEFRAEFAQDISFAARQLVRARSFSIVAILTFALGIGATAAVFSALYAIVLKPLPFDHPERVVVLQPMIKNEVLGLSAAEYLELRDRASAAATSPTASNSTSFEHVAALLGQYGFTITDGNIPELVGGGRATHDYFAVFGVQPIAGRTFDANEDTPGHDHVVVLSHRFWMSHYSGENGAVGRTMHLNGEAYLIVGVMPASFDIQADGDELWTPLTITAEDAAKSGAHYLAAFARLKPGVTIEQARAQTTAILRELASRSPDPNSPVTDHGMKVVTFSERLVGDYRPLLYTLLGAVGFVLLIACTNIANLLLSRGTSRAKELAIRVALGAGRGRLLRQLLTESLILALTGAVVGLGLAFAILRGVRAISPDGVPRLDSATVDLPMLAFTLVTAVVCSIAFGLAPALRASGTSLQGTLRESGRGSTSGGRDPLRNILVGAEVALAMTLLTGAGLLIRSAWQVQQVDPGFDARGVLTARLILPAAQYPDANIITQTYARIRDEAARIPGVRLAALGLVVPLSGSATQSSVRAEGGAAADALAHANLRLVSPQYFDVMSIPRRAGRDFTIRDDASAPNVVVINETLAHKLWPGLGFASIIGKRLDALSAKRGVPEYKEVVGVVGDLHDAALNKPVAPEFYLPVPQTPAAFWPFIQRSLVVVVKSANISIDPMTLRKPLEAAVANVDRSLPLADAKSMESHVRTSMEQARFNTILLSALGVIALALSSVGVYGVVSYFVNQRTQEIGIRMALGASPKQIWREVVRRGLSPIAVGIVAGFVMSIFTANVLRSQLFQIGTTDPGTYGAVGALLLLVSLAATYLPARRAMRVAPIVALSAG